MGPSFGRFNLARPINVRLGEAALRRLTWCWCLLWAVFTESDVIFEVTCCNRSNGDTEPRAEESIIRYPS